MKNILITVYATLAELPILEKRYGGLLSHYRIEKCERLKNAMDRERGRLAEYCLIEAIRHAGVPMSLPLVIGTESSGKPYLTNIPLHISLSHAGEYAAAAVSELPVGVDIEQTRDVSENLIRRICTEREWEEVWKKHPVPETFRNLFSAKESIVKQSGEGLAALCRVDIAESIPVRQKQIEPYVLSICGQAEQWEVFRCPKES